MLSDFCSAGNSTKDLDGQVLNKSGVLKISWIAFVHFL